MLLSGKELAEKIIKEIRSEVDAGRITPKLGIVVVGDYKPSHIYVKRKIETAKKAGIETEVFELNEDEKEGELLDLIKKLNENEKIDGYIVQLPLPKHINANKVMEAIEPKKDVDGFHPSNMGKILLNLPDEVFAPATPSGIMKIIEHYKIPVSGANAVVVGRSNIVGKPIAIMLLQKDATVTVCHSKTKDLSSYTKNADILVVAAGSPCLIKPEMVKKGAYVIDVGTTRVDAPAKTGNLTGNPARNLRRSRRNADDNELKTASMVVGDVDPEVQKKANVSPVPGGVGPLTVAMLLQNTLKAAKMRKFR